MTQNLPLRYLRSVPPSLVGPDVRLLTPWIVGQKLTLIGVFIQTGAFVPSSFSSCPFPVGDMDPSNTWFPGPTQVFNPNSISIGSAVFAGLTTVTDRPTDRPTDHGTRSVTIGRRIYVGYVVLRCGLSVSAQSQYVMSQLRSSDRLTGSPRGQHQ